MPASASGSVASPWAVAQVAAVSDGRFFSQRALRKGYQVQQAVARMAKPAPVAYRKGSPSSCMARCSSVWLTSAMPVASTSSAGASRRQGSVRSLRLETIAITSGSVPMIIVGSGAPASWMPVARAL